MLTDFFLDLRKAGVPVSIHEFLQLLELLTSPQAPLSSQDFYYVARLALVKNEAFFDRFDRVFAHHIDALEQTIEAHPRLPESWMQLVTRRQLSDQDRASLKKHGWDRLMELFRQRLAEQKKRHAGGTKWIGTGGLSAFGHSGHHPEGIRLGGPSAGNQTAVTVWEQRHYRDYDDRQTLGTRNFQMALRRLRRFAREGSQLELDLPGTVRNTADRGGQLDLRWIPERRNTIKVLMLLDVGGSMDSHVRLVESLFSAARSEFRHLEVFYFHNCPYEFVWPSNARRHNECIDTWSLLRRYGEDWRLILVGDASMSPYELLYPGGSIEHHNTETGVAWLQRILRQWPNAVWLNPEPVSVWKYRQSIDIIQNLIGGHMYGITIDGLSQAMRQLSR